MGEDLVPDSHAAEPELLAWEDLGVRSFGQAFRSSMAELLGHPRRFFSAMATDGGLHEPVSFFAMVLAAATLLAFGAALAHFGLTAPDPTQVTPEQYGAASLPPRAAGIAAVLLPLFLVLASVAMVVVGTLLHLAGSLFGCRRWEATVSVWLYAASAALMPIVLVLAAVFAMSLLGYLLGRVWPGAHGGAATAVQWATFLLVGAGIITGLVLLVSHVALGLANAHGLDATRGAAAAVIGLLCAACLVFGLVRVYATYGAGAGLATTAACSIVGLGVAGLFSMLSRRAEWSA